MNDKELIEILIKKYDEKNRDGVLIESKTREFIISHKDLCYCLSFNELKDEVGDEKGYEIIDFFKLE